MRLVRARHKGREFQARLEGTLIVPTDGGPKLPLHTVTLLPPIQPSKIVCVGLNYYAHAQELGMRVPEEPQIFLKPPSALLGPAQEIVLPPQSSRVDFEGELAVVIAAPCRNLGSEAVADHVLGLCCANDVTARDIQRRDGLYARAKGFDTFAPVGPWIATQFPPPEELALHTRVNGEVRQQSQTKDMIWTPWQLVAYISQCMTLLPGDIVLTGTPPGIGPLSPNDTVEISIQGVGTLSNSVVAAPCGAD
ncbi:MAG: fumarylacetoacetate hydrolase family protein [Desulfohalobium sp.]